MGALASEPVAALGVVAPASLQGLNPTVSLALAAALAEVSPPIGAIPTFETVNRLTDQGLAAEYGDLLTSFAHNGVLDRRRLHRIGSGFGSRSILQPAQQVPGWRRRRPVGREAQRELPGERGRIVRPFDDRDTGRIEHRKAVQQNVKQRRVTDPDGARLREAELRCREFRC